MKFVPALTETDKEALTHLHSDGPTHRQRQRAQAVLLSAKGYTLEQIADVLDAGRNTVSGWLDQWQAQGLDGLCDAPKPGRRHKIDAALEAELLDLLQNPTPDLKAVVQAHLKKKRSQLPGTP
jgi:transposase